MLGEQQQRIAELATTVEALTERVVELDVELANIDQTVFGDQRQALRNQSRRARFQASRAAARTEKLLRRAGELMDSGTLSSLDPRLDGD